MLMAYTINGARLQLQEDEVGSIKVGKAADLVVLDRDITVDTRRGHQHRKGPAYVR